MEGISEDIALFTKGCEHLLSALAQKTQLSEIERQLIAYYWREITAQTQDLRDELEEGEEGHAVVPSDTGRL